MQGLLIDERMLKFRHIVKNGILSVSVLMGTPMQLVQILPTFHTKMGDHLF